MHHPITIIGSGLAGYAVARELRKLDQQFPLRLVTTDEGHFYSKPLLSNALAQEKTPVHLINTPAADMAEQLNVQILTQTVVTAIDLQHQALSMAEKQLHYSQLVLAWGAGPIQLPIAGKAAEHIFSINDLTDYTRFYQALQTARHVTIMGAGLIGCEFANDLRLGGFEVSVVDPMTYVLSRLVPEAIGQVLQTALEALGVTFFFRKAVKKMEFAANRYQLTLSDNSTLLTDVVLSAVGLRPRTALAATAGLTVEQGITVDRYLKTSAENIYALGDCAQVEGLVLPFVMPLMQAARALARTLTGHPTPVHYPMMPIVVKTPACPFVVCPPTTASKGAWQVEGTGQNKRALFYTDVGQLNGFALTGNCITEKMALARALPPLLNSSS